MICIYHPGPLSRSRCRYGCVSRGHLSSAASLQDSLLLFSEASNFINLIPPQSHQRSQSAKFEKVDNCLETFDCEPQSGSTGTILESDAVLERTSFNEHSSSSHNVCYLLPSALLQTIVSLRTQPLPLATSQCNGQWSPGTFKFIFELVSSLARVTSAESA